MKKTIFKVRCKCGSTAFFVEEKNLFETTLSSKGILNVVDVKNSPFKITCKNCMKRYKLTDFNGLSYRSTIYKNKDIERTDKREQHTIMVREKMAKRAVGN